MTERDDDLTFIGTENLRRLSEIPDDRHREAIERGIDLGLEAAESVQDRTISTFSRGYQPAFAGIKTFMKSPYLEDVHQLPGHEVAILGAPFDMGTTFRSGARGRRRPSATSRPCTTGTTSISPSTSPRNSTWSTSATCS